MTRPLAAHTRSIAKQTLLGVVAMLALVLGATVALAADGGGTDESETTETTETSVDTSETTDTTEGETTETTEGETTDTTETTDSTEPEPETLEPAPEVEDGEFRNHGEAVSKAAREDCEPGPGHGVCVSAVAKGDDGKKSGADDDDETELESEDDDLEPDDDDDDESDERGKPDKARGKK